MSKEVGDANNSEKYKLFPIIPIIPKLRTAVMLDYPIASEILLSFPDEWQLAGTLRCEDQYGSSNLYVGAFPKEVERTRRDHFHGLSPEINLAANTYRHYKLFQPWPQPSIIAEFDQESQESGVGRVAGQGYLRVRMHEIGEAQVWFGKGVGVIWECFTEESQRKLARWQEELAGFWQVVERDVASPPHSAHSATPAPTPSTPFTFYTQPHEPTFEEGYADFLARLGYAPDPQYPQWWSKRR